MINIKSFLCILAMMICVACAKDEERDPLEAPLMNTTWTIIKVEVIDLNDVILHSLEFDPDQACNTSIKFNNNQRIDLKDCGDFGCGEWSVQNGNIKFVIAFFQMIPGHCAQNNFSSIYTADNKAELSQDVLAIEGFGPTMGKIYQLSNWAELINASNKGQIKFRTYFISTQHEITNGSTCCGKFSWI